MANRKIESEVQQIFEKYTKNHGRRLKRDVAVNMLQTEFSLSEGDAEVLFEIFDKDKNNELSLWEFQQFYTCIGLEAKETLNLFHKLEKDESGMVDIEKCFDSMKGMKTAAGKGLEEKDIVMLLKATAGPDKTIDLPKFISLVTRVKFFKG